MKRAKATGFFVGFLLIPVLAFAQISVGGCPLVPTTNQTTPTSTSPTTTTPGNPQVGTTPSTPSNANGNCSAGLVSSGSLPDNLAAAKMVVAAPMSTVETGPNAAAQAAANNYYVQTVLPDPSSYQSQLNEFHNAWGCPSSNSVYCRVDGAMPIKGATTAETLQWAAHKWNLDPRLLYAEATIDGDWNILSLGDGGCSVGPMQVAFCNNSSHPNHAFPGLNGTTLANENIAFNADMYAATIYGAYIGQIDSCAQNNIAVSINQWDYGLNTCGTGDWSQQTCSAIANQSWSRFFNGNTNLPD